ncbi:GGDEF domain-containing protein [Rubellimicrobium aerolatum]|uniref:diguanylate cyclase n=1 Tax=Rubellimicrobium aerolatum TaxID=490979 RepID=A0ABW0SG88_9RHOB|nr:GGDEF domain-containing protein [Rubellimicrobium aerolatum]MBP1807386.1 diguanylate cyclase [Rubellimicrobium aerolatum]
MHLTTDLFQPIPGTLALMGLLAPSYGAVLRHARRPRRGQLGLGALCGAAAAFAMWQGTPLGEGWIVDLRSVPVTLAGAYLSPPGAAIAVLIAVAARLGLGGAGALAGCLILVVAAGAGWLWNRLTRPRPSMSWRALLGLAILSLSHVAAMLTAPPGMLRVLLGEVLPVHVPLHVAGVTLVGLLLERERLAAERERRLTHAAERDPLTGLLNRRGLDRALGRLPEDAGLAYLCCDLDHFKRVNDAYGHAAGDTVLKGVAERLREALRPEDLLGRTGGEEFVIAMPGLDASEGARAAARLRDLLRSRPFDLPEGEVAVTASIGGVWTESPLGLDTARTGADEALYAVKRSGRDGVRFEAARAVRRRRALEPA